MIGAVTQRVPGQGWTVGVLLWIGVLMNYIDRIDISVAAPQLQQEFGLIPEDLGRLFSAFFWSYSLLQVPGGMVLDRFGARHVGRWGTLLWAVASAVTAIAETPAFPRAKRLPAIDFRAASEPALLRSSIPRRNSPTSLASLGRIEPIPSRSDPVRSGAAGQ